MADFNEQKRQSYRRSFRTDGTRSEVRVLARIIRSATVDDSLRFDANLDVDLVLILGNAEEATDKVKLHLRDEIRGQSLIVSSSSTQNFGRSGPYHSLDHSILTLRAEHGESTRLGKVVQEFSVLYSGSNSEHEILLAAKGSEKLGAELVGPVVQEHELSGRRKGRLGCIVQFCGKFGRS